MTSTPPSPAAPPPSGSFNPKWILIGCGGAAALGLMLLIAVGGLIWFFSGRSAAKPERPATPWTVRPATGGFASDSSGANVTVPAGAVDRDVAITVTTQPADALSSPDIRVVGRIASFQVDGQEHFRFKKPVRLMIPIDRSLAKPGSPIALSQWDGKQWISAGASTVSGDSVLADVTHFSQYAPTQGGGGPAPNPNQPSALTDVAAWHGQVEFSLTGGWGHKDAVSSSNHTVSRTGSALFRCSRRMSFGDGKVRWASSFDEPLDRIVVQGRVDDDWYVTDSDYDKTGNVFSRSNTHGGGSTPGRVGVTVEIDTQARTYQISGSEVRVGPSVHNHWVEPNGKADPPRHSFVTVKLLIGPRPLPAADPSGGFTDNIDVPLHSWSYVTPNDLTPDPKHCRGRITVSLTPVPFTLKAKISGPPVVYRGDAVTLDGSGSTGDIVSYRWSFDVDPKCPAPTKDVHPTGDSVSFSALWSFKATLEVTDKSGNIARAEHPVEVRPRDGWKTTFESKKDKDLPFPAWPMYANSADVALGDWVQSDPHYAQWLDVARGANKSGGLHIGVNHCACEPPEVVTSHWIHTSVKTPKKYRYEGYELILLRDDGPFSGLIYVQSQKLKIERRECVNAALQRGGAVQALNQRRGKAGAAASLLSLGLAHEQMHSTLLEKGLRDLQRQDQDPARLIEPLIGDDPQALEEKADKIIYAAEAAIGTESTEDKVQAELAKKGLTSSLRIWLPVSLTDKNNNSIETDKDLGPLYKIGDK